MRRHFLGFTAIAFAAALLPAAVNAQNTRSTEIQGNQPNAAYSMQHRDYMRGYVRARPMSEFEGSAVGVAGSAQSSAQTSATSAAGANNGGNIALGANVPTSMRLRPMQGDAAYANYRYGRAGNQYVVVDSAGKILDTFE